MNIFKKFLVFLLLSISTGNVLLAMDDQNNSNNNNINNNKNNKKCKMVTTEITPKGILLPSTVSISWDTDDFPLVDPNNLPNSWQLLYRLDQLIKSNPYENEKKEYYNKILSLLSKNPDLNRKNNYGEDFYYFFNHPDYKILYDLFAEYLHTQLINCIPKNILSIILEYSKDAYVCQRCPESFSEKNDFDQHNIESHPYECEKCKCRFDDKNNLTKHALIHIGNKVYNCNLCNIDFVDNYLTKHMYTYHTAKKKLYECNKCGYVCIIKSIFNRHMRNHCQKSYSY